MLELQRPDRISSNHTCSSVSKSAVKPPRDRARYLGAKLGRNPLIGADIKSWGLKQSKIAVDSWGIWKGRHNKNASKKRAIARFRSFYQIFVLDGHRADHGGLTSEWLPPEQSRAKQKLRTSLSNKTSDWNRRLWNWLFQLLWMRLKTGVLWFPLLRLEDA